MRLAHLVPVSLLDTLPGNQRTHLVISELVLSDERYRRFYAERAAAGDLVIVDNPVHEDRKVTIEQWLTAVYYIQPSVAVIPDVIDSYQMTIDSCRLAVQEFPRNESSAELMAVPHGNTQHEWLHCARELARMPEITWFGISLERRLRDDTFALARRRERVRYLISQPEYFARIKLHLLGISESGAELGDDEIWKRATSADVSKFAVWNMLGTPVTPPVPITQPYPGRKPFGGSYEYFLSGHPQGLSRRKMRRNLARWVEYAERKQDLCPGFTPHLSERIRRFCYSSIE